MNSGALSSIPSGSQFTQAMVNQTPRFDQQTVYDRRLKIRRPTKRRKKIKWI